MPDPLVTLEGVSARYGAVQALRSLSLSVLPGQATAVLGANGAGKTTLLRLISGQLRPSEGRLLLDGSDVRRPRAYQIARQGIVHVPEGRQVFAKLTIQENLALGGYGRRESEVKDDVQAMFDRFPILGERKKQRAGLLSGGEQQMLAIARGIMARPRLMMLDEPSMGLAPRVVSEVFSLLADLRDEGLALLVVEQNAAAALKLASYAYVLQRGELVAHGTPPELLSGGHVQSAYLGQAAGTSN
jgi:branched-chain amino acid transport system ATP-binding protein